MQRRKALQLSSGNAPESSKLKKMRTRKRRASRESSVRFNLVFVVLLLGVLVAGYVVMSQHEEVQLHNLKKEMYANKIEPLSHEWEEKYAALQEENEKLHKELSSNDGLEEEIKKERNESQEKLELEAKKVQQLQLAKQKLKENIKLMSKTALLDKFGPGPHYVEINLEFPNVEADATAKILVELAPVEEMPHTVYWFLEQVSRKLYDGCSFHRNAGHVIQGGPAPNFLSPPEPQLNKNFVDAGFHSVLFQEYSPKFPHEKYTLGFAGRPGGPDFYISTMDNTRLHGPGGQTNYEDPTEADPCFAKVVDGIDVVQRMEQLETKDGAYKSLVDNVAITSMTIVRK